MHTWQLTKPQQTPEKDVEIVEDGDVAAEEAGLHGVSNQIQAARHI